MATPPKIYLGFDPGGKTHFGVAFLEEERLITTTVSSVAEAVAWSHNMCGSRPVFAAGIDTLLHWSLAESGWRSCDLELRGRYPSRAKSVMAPNSLYGSMVIGGVALAIKLRESWVEIVLNETHPKVFLGQLAADQSELDSLPDAISWFKKKAGLSDCNIGGEHAFDAALSAWATREGMEQCWPDIIGDKTNLIFPSGDVRYLWPASDSGEAKSM